MRDFPIELVNTVIENVSATADLLCLRSVNATCQDLVTPKVFRKLCIQNSLQSVQNFQKVLESDTLAPHVREVVYDLRDQETFRLLQSSESVCSDELEIAELEEALTEAFCALPQFTGLESISLNFWPKYVTQSGQEVQEQPFWFTNRQLTVLHAVHHAMRTSRASSLSLNNVVLMSSACYDFVSSLTNSPLSHLALSVVGNGEVSPWSGSKSLNGSLGSLLPPSNSKLSSLVLRSPMGLYHSPASQLSSFTYPSLQSLVVENIMFDHVSSDGVEAFIARHKHSLRRLELRSCASYVAGDSTGNAHWSAIWERLRSELTNLEELVVDSGSQGYARLDPTLGYIPHIKLDSERAEDDMKAFQEFYAFLKTRKCIVA
ncbi:hypothetical protein BJ138DRAFT_1007585 [Hygrophoropsis aurantiaca]|uniref:Uncharacterized protein n=1 Tax=Hygrophoropsis aurantiaca TaxID=72124 RepID=A0ACB8AE49_9AGAM|nr:hypothetical protein BJ138DRAFT_1007585 [Hygrophoropsis aurantiaca]